MNKYTGQVRPDAPHRLCNVPVDMAHPQRHMCTHHLLLSLQGLCNGSSQHAASMTKWHATKHGSMDLCK
jgi:hypothetical protein